MENKNSLINPFEHIGLLHNQGLEYAFKLINEKTTLEQAVELASQFMQCLDGDYTKNSLANNYAFISESINRTEKIELNDFLDGLLEKKLITNEGISFINEINNISYDALNIPKEILEIEKRILNSEMSVEDQRFPLIFATVTRNSAIFGINNSAILYSRHWPWKKDGQGAIDGFASGAITGAITGGFPGSVVGALTGAIGGGIGRSLVSWIKSLFSES